MRRVRKARLASNLRGELSGPLSRACTGCGAAKGWRCVKLVAGVVQPRKTFCRERVVKGGGTGEQVPRAGETS